MLGLLFLYGKPPEGGIPHPTVRCQRKGHITIVACRGKHISLWQTHGLQKLWHNSGSLGSFADFALFPYHKDVNESLETLLLHPQ